MARARYPKHAGPPPPPPPPLPPETRTVGQVVGESVKFYRDNFFPSLSLGLGAAIMGVGNATIDAKGGNLLFGMTVGGLLMTIAFMAATILVRNLDFERGTAARALVAGMIVYLPVPMLTNLYVLPAVLWLALVGLLVPVILVERLGIWGGLRRAVELSRRDYVHVAGSFATLAILAYLCATILTFVLRHQGEAVQSVAAFFGVLVTAPLFMIGAVIVYDDQRARLESGLSRRERLRARKEHVATAPRATVPSRLGRAPRPRRPNAE